MGAPPARIVALALAALMAIACGTSNVSNDADVTITGSIKNPNGSAASGVTVGLLKEPGAVDALFELAVTVSSVGLLCLTQTVTICKGARKTTTDAGGKYSFTMRGKDSKTVLGNPGSFLVSSALADGGPSLQIRFEVTQDSVAVPETTFWQPAELEVNADKTSVRYQWSPITTVGKPKYAVAVTSGPSEVWYQETNPRDQLDARIAGDIDGHLHAVATSEQTGSGTTFATAHHSQKQRLRGQAGPAMSRASTCSVAGQDGPVPVTPCVFTDGDFGGQFPTQRCVTASPAPSASPLPCRAGTWVAVDLGSARPVSAVTLHGLQLTSDFIVESSVDGSQWTQRGRHRPSAYAQLTFTPVQARHLRLRPLNGTDTIRALREFSVWP